MNNYYGYIESSDFKPAEYFWRIWHQTALHQVQPNTIWGDIFRKNEAVLEAHDGPITY